MHGLLRCSQSVPGDVPQEAANVVEMSADLSKNRRRTDD